MKIKGITTQQLRAIVNQVSDDDYDGNIVFKREPESSGNFVFFTLTVLKSANVGGRRSNTGRKIAAACWHAHRDVMHAIFDLNPDAVLVSALARYEGQEDFLDKFPDTGYTNIGSQYQPLDMEDACECGY